MKNRGAMGSENVGLSNRKSGEIPGRRKPKVSLAMYVSQGLAGPNPCSPMGRCGDGQGVNIHPPHYISMKGRSLVSRAYYRIYVCILRVPLW